MSAEQLHETLLVLLHSNVAAVATTAARTAVVAGEPLPPSDLGTSATPRHVRRLTDRTDRSAEDRAPAGRASGMSAK